jgi:DNA-directed RNA polymerase subunit H (RpoH/RPB5)
LLDKYKQEDNYIMVFTKEPLSVYIKKAIKQYPLLHIQNYLYKHFTMELNKGPLCSKHTILSPEDARKVCFELMTHGHKLPSISVDDPQNIWIGGKINDIIKIEAVSEITGTCIRYRLVTPISGKVEQSSESTARSNKLKNSKKVIIDENSSEKKEDVSDIVEEEYEEYDEYDEDEDYGNEEE